MAEVFSNQCQQRRAFRERAQPRRVRHALITGRAGAETAAPLLRSNVEPLLTGATHKRPALHPPSDGYFRSLGSFGSFDPIVIFLVVVSWFVIFCPSCLHANNR